MQAALLKIFFSKQGQKVSKAVIGGGIGVVLIFVSLLSFFFADTTDGKTDPYKDAIKTLMVEKKVKSSSISPSVIRAVDIVIYESIETRTKEAILVDLKLYYIDVKNEKSEVCEEQETELGGVETICTTINVEMITFKEMDNMLATLQTEKKLTDEQIEEIRMLIQFAKDGGAFEDEIGAGVPIPTTGGYVLPTASGSITCSYGCYPGHIGTDVGSYSGTDIMVVADGLVLETQNDCQEGNQECGGGYGNNVKVVHQVDGVNIVTIYGHMLQGSVRVTQGEQLKQGHVIGGMGNTGISSGTHLHFEMLVGIDYFPGSKSIRLKYVVNTEEVLRYPGSW